ncbi:recombinase family protein [Streptococcus suis]
MCHYIGRRVNVRKKIRANKQKHKKRVCAYIRVSTTNGSQLELLENQKQYFEKLYSNRDDIDFVGVYHDRGISGSKDNRPNFQAMIEDCRKGMIDIIHTKSIARFARNTLDCIKYVRELKELGVGVTFEKENIDSLDSKGEVLLTIFFSLSTG